MKKTETIELKLFLIFLSILFFTNLFCQSKDTVVKVKNSWYGRAMPVSLYTGAGYLILNR